MTQGHRKRREAAVADGLRPAPSSHYLRVHQDASDLSRLPEAWDQDALIGFYFLSLSRLQGAHNEAFADHRKTSVKAES